MHQSDRNRQITFVESREKNRKRKVKENESRSDLRRFGCGIDGSGLFLGEVRTLRLFVKVLRTKIERGL